MAVIQQDIADKLNLSVATVSRSLRNDNAINPDTRARVLELAGQMGYKSNGTIRNRRVRRSSKFKSPIKSAPVCAMIQSDIAVDRDMQMDTQGAHRVLAGMSEGAHRLNIPLQVHYIMLQDVDRADDPDRLPAPVRDGETAGLVLIHYFPPEVVSRLSQQHVCVSVNNVYAKCDVDSVVGDQVGTTAQLVEHLRAKGHERIGFIRENRKRSWVRSRFAGYVDGLMQQDLPYSPQDVIEVSLGDDDWSSPIETVLRGMDRGITAFMCANDSIGYRLIAKLNKLGIRVGEDISLTGFDAVVPPMGMKRLTSIRMPLEHMGSAAVELALRSSKDSQAPRQQIQMECQLVEGETT